jgi:2-polyprenyl-6-methoxyphenol hydroxylase-like FAD-dependent oxidoreductase
MTHDIIIVGARCAGSALAMLLAQRGAKVLLLDRATFPSDIPHGHFIHRHGPARLRRWGLLDEVARATPAIDVMLTDFGDFPLVARDLAHDGVAWGYGPRRTTLDAILVNAAMTNGAELRERFTVEDYLFDGDRIVGIRGRTVQGSAVEERAALVVGADGRRSKLAATVKAQTYQETPPLLCYYFSYWSGVQSEPFELYVNTSRQRVIFSFKTEDDLMAVFIGFPMAEMPLVRTDLERHMLAALDEARDLGHRVRAGRREERFYGATDLPNFYRTPCGPGWALVGDAGLHKDPYLALGICDALRDAELLADAIGSGLGGAQPMDDALAAFERQRNQASAADYEENLAAARFTPMPPEAFALRAAVRHNPEQATLLMKARNRLIDPAEFFNPANLQRVLGAQGT